VLLLLAIHARDAAQGALHRAAGLHACLRCKRPCAVQLLLQAAHHDAVAALAKRLLLLLLVESCLLVLLLLPGRLKEALVAAERRAREAALSGAKMQAGGLLNTAHRVKQHEACTHKGPLTSAMGAAPAPCVL
jgi:hypothetical protein